MEIKNAEETNQPAPDVAGDPDMIPTIEDGPPVTDSDDPADGAEISDVDKREDGPPEDKGEAKPGDDAGKEKKDAGKAEDREGFIPRDRFDEVNSQAKKVPELEKQIAKLSGQIEILSKQPAPDIQQDPGGEPDFIASLEGKDNEALMDQFEEDPAGFLKSYGDSLARRINDGLKSESAANDFEARVTKTIEAFANDHPDFNDLWDRGDIGKFMDDNPGFDATGAYFALTQPSREAATKQQIDEAVSKAIKETEAKFQKLLKREYASVPGGPASTDTGAGTPPELQDTNKHGGVVKSIASRVLARRQSA